MKIVINNTFGGFGLSEKALALYEQRTGAEIGSVFVYDITRDDPVLIQIVEELGQEAWGEFASLKVVEVPDGISWYIHEYDGIETIHETHRFWS